MAELDQIATDESKSTKSAPTTEEAVEFALLFALLAGSGASGDTDKYRTIVTTTFTKMLDGFGYKIVPK